MPSNKSNLNKHNSTSRNWKTKKTMKKNKKGNQHGDSQTFRMYVSGLPGDTKKKELERFLKQFGDFSHLKLPMRKTNGAKECKGHAKIMLKDEKTKLRIFEEGHLRKFKGKHILKFESYLEGQSLVHKMASIEEKKVSIYGEHNVEHSKLVTAFSKFGNIKKLTWKVKEDKPPQTGVELIPGNKGAEEEAERAESSSKPDSSKKEYYGNITFSQKESAVMCLKTGKAEISPDIVVRVRPYLAQFLAKKNLLNSQSQTRKNSEATQNEIAELDTVEISLSQLNLTSPSQRLQERKQHCYQNLRFNSVNLDGDHPTEAQQTALFFPSIEELCLDSGSNRCQEAKEEEEQPTRIGKGHILEISESPYCSKERNSGGFSISSFYNRTNSFDWISESRRENSFPPVNLFRYNPDGLNHLQNF